MVGILCDYEVFGRGKARGTLRGPRLCVVDEFDTAPFAVETERLALHSFAWRGRAELTELADKSRHWKNHNYCHYRHSKKHRDCCMVLAVVPVEQESMSSSYDRTKNSYHHRRLLF